LILLLLIDSTRVFAADIFYISPKEIGLNTNLGSSQEKPWATFAYAIPKLGPGDTLVLMDGVYTPDNAGKLWVTGVTGTIGHPITIKALNDGKATVDGAGKKIPFYILGDEINRITDINVEGIHFQNSPDEVFRVGYSDRINVRRVSAANAAFGSIFYVKKSTYV